MNFLDILWPALVLAALGLLFGLALAFAAKKFKVERDERFEPVREALPGANCGGCGYPGCDGLAEAIVKGEAPVDKCPVGGRACAEKIAEIMGVVACVDIPPKAYVRCQANLGEVAKRFEYEGIRDCRAAADVAGGFLNCRFACLGLGTCERACPFGAIKVTGGIAKVDKDMCRGCGVCVESCPRDVIALLPENAYVYVACRNTDSGKAVRSVCSKGCIGCRMCEKQCQHDAIKVVNGVAVIDHHNCVGCGACAAKCPTKCIVNYLPKPEEQVEAV